jgi:hypothetical protein
MPGARPKNGVSELPPKNTREKLREGFGRKKLNYFSNQCNSRQVKIQEIPDLIPFFSYTWQKKI